ncbi:MAG: ABC transporter permease [Beijerinckiaceae bacterium]|nr:ABC transporter permease [Beijerinckiaceae bacterium]
MTALRCLGIVLLGAIGLLALVGPALAPPPDAQDLGSALSAPNFAEPLGRDWLGRSVLSRLAHGAWTSLGVAAGAVGAATIFGALLGSIAAAVTGMRTPVRWCLDVFQAFPSFIVLLLLSAIFPPTAFSIGIAVALVTWVEPCRIALLTGEAASRHPAVEAARLVEMSRRSILRHFIIPPLVRPLLAVGGLMFGHTILAVAALGFLGLGLRPPTPEWGTMISEALPYFDEAPHLIFAPSLAIAASVTGILLTFDREPTS